MWDDVVVQLQVVVTRMHGIFAPHWMKRADRPSNTSQEEKQDGVVPLTFASLHTIMVVKLPPLHPLALQRMRPRIELG